MKAKILLICFIFSLTYCSIPTIQPLNTILYQQSNYSLNYFSTKNLTLSSYFQIDFSASDITIPSSNSTNYCLVKINDTTASSANCSCNTSVCKIYPKTTTTLNSNIIITFGPLINPSYSYQQKVGVFISFYPSNNQSSNITISSSIYQSMAITVNSFIQSDYGVGTNNVQYTFNLSFPYYPNNPQIQITIPTQVGYSTLTSQYSFYGTIQNNQMIQASNIIILSTIANTNPTPNGFMLLKIKGFINPQFIGNSSNFSIIMLQQYTSNNTNCANCKVAELFTSLQATSTTSGNIQVSIFNSTNLLVDKTTNLTIGLNLVAPIPVGGRLSIIFDSGITVPITYCDDIYGFTLTNGTVPICNYNSSKNAIVTSNFAVPYLYSQGNVIILVQVVNPPDNRQININFQTQDASGRIIGKSRQSYPYSSAPSLLNVSVSKNNSQIQAAFKLQVNISITHNINTTTDQLLVVLPPSSLYNFSAITCLSSSINLNCNKNTDSVSNLVITFTPPCSNCSINSQISFTIDNLDNPSFINNQTQIIYIQMKNSHGIMQSSQNSVALSAMKLNLPSYDWQGNNLVGQYYILNMSVTIPQYIKQNGGILRIQFQQNSSYADVIPDYQNIGSYDLVYSLMVTDSSNISLTNNVQYFYNSFPYSIQAINIQICTTNTSCSGNINVFGLRRSFYTLPTLYQTIKALTINGDTISSVLMQAVSQNPIKITQNLGLNLSQSVTNSISSYQMSFIMNKLPFDSGLIISFSSMHKINVASGCFFISNTSLLGFTFNCTVLNQQNIQITYSGDSTMMTFQNIMYLVTIKSVLNPPSIVPLSYIIGTTIKSTVNCQSTISYSISTAFNLNTSYSKSNNTYDQATNLSVSIYPNFYPFDSLTLYISKNLFVFEGILWNSYTNAQNSTFYILKNIYNLNNSQLIINGFNPKSTGISGPIYLEMYVGGYLSSQGKILINNVQPIFLPLSAFTSNKYVGQNTNLTIKINRQIVYPQELKVTVLIPTNLLNFNFNNGSYIYTSMDLSQFSLTTSLTSQIQTINIYNLTNMNFIPNNLTLLNLANVKVYTIDQQNNPVAQSWIQDLNLVPSMTSSAQTYIFQRSSSQSNQIIHLNISYISNYPQNASIMQIYLPENQNQFIGQSYCIYTGIAPNDVNCTVYNQNKSYIRIAYKDGARIILKNLINLYPSNENMTIILLTSNNELIQNSTSQITPTIQLDPLTLSGNSNSTKVASPAQLNFNLTNLNADIQIGSILKIQFPKYFYTKIPSLNPKDCLYQILGINYTGCQYQNQQSGWLQFVTLNNLGPVNIPKNSSIYIKLYLTNSWTTYKFSHNSTSFNIISSNNQYTAFGILALGSIYSNLSSFSQITFNSVTISQSNMSCSAENSLQFILKTNQVIPLNASFYFLVPRANYNNNNSTYLVSTLDYNYYNFNIPVTCSFNNTYICENYNSTKTLSLKLQNFQYVSQSNFSISVYIMYDGLPMTQIYTQNMGNHIPLPIPGIEITRLNRKVNESTQIQIALNAMLQKSNDFYIQIRSSPGIINSLLNSYQKVSFSQNSSFNLNSNLTLPFVNQGTRLTIYINSLPMYNVNISIFGINPRFALLNNENYDIKLYDSDYVYYLTQNLTIDGSLLPYSTGLSITRSSDLVGAIASYTLIGTLPDSLLSMQVSFNDSKAIDLNNASLNVILGTFTNPSSIYWNNTNKVIIYNKTFLLYENLNVPMINSLQSYNLSTVNKITYSKTMIVNNTYNLSVTFNNSVISYNLIVVLPIFFKTFLNCTINNVLQNNYTLQQISVNNTKMYKLNIINAKNIAINNLTLNFITNDYQSIIIDNNIIVQTQLPTKSYVQTFNLNLLGTQISSSISSTSLKVNDQSNYAIKINALNKDGVLKLIFPSFLNSQIETYLSSANSQNKMLLKLNSVNSSINLYKNNLTNLFYTQIYVNSLSVQLEFSLKNFTNPSTNQPYNFQIMQANPINNSQIYGYNSLILQMEQLDNIYIYEATRNQSKVGLPVQITLNITNPQNGNNTLIITLPVDQVLQRTQTNCSVKSIAEQNIQTLFCKWHPTLINAIITQKINNNSLYIINGFKNVNFSKVPNENDKVSAFIGQPYKSASSKLKDSVFIIPLVTAGNLTLQNCSSSNNQIFSKPILDFQINLQNYLQVDSILITLDPFNYLIDSNLQCSLNGLVQQCWKSTDNSIMINSPSLKTSNIKISIISGIINNLQARNFTIQTLKYLNPNSTALSNSIKASNINSIQIKTASLSSFGVIDVYYSTLGDSPTLQANSQLSSRIIVTQNYVSATPATISIIFDNMVALPIKFIQLSDLKANLTTNIQNCNFYNIQFNQTINKQCLFNNSLNAKISFSLFYNYTEDILISSVEKNLFIYPAPSNNCNNQQCDLCSTVKGNQYCFSCREGLYQSNGQCVESCPKGYVNDLLSLSCQPCSPTCGSCYALYSEDCLSCSQTNLILSNGNCVQNCDNGEFQYNGYCVMNEECHNLNGCRICSNDGFCYQCLPSYERKLTQCIYKSQLPALIMSYFQIIILISSIIFIGIGIFKTNQQKFKSGLMLFIFSISISQFCSWILIIPQSPNIPLGIFLVFICICRMLISITIYARFYRHNLGQLSKHILNQDQKQVQTEKQKNSAIQQSKSENKQEEQQINNWKSKLVRFFCCFNGPDSLCLLQSKIAPPIIKLPSNFIYQGVYQLCRIVAIIFLGYLITLNVPGDLTILPLISIICGLSIILIRFGMSQTASKIQKCLRNSQ